jgi:glycosyltransferase involved in cell wall biosynthesis
MQVAIVTPTIGSEHLKQCIDSVQAQTYKDFKHYIFIDGLDVKYKEGWPGYINNLPNVKQVSLDENVGKGWYGHRVYAACSFLVNTDIIIYLDEDNWLQPNHVQSIVDTFKRGYDWVYSLRNINEKDGAYEFYKIIVH